MKITDILLAEHFVLRNAFDQIQRQLPRLRTLAEVKVVAHLLKNLLQGHSKAEQDLVFPALAHCLQELGQLQNFELEHREIHASLARAQVAKRMVEARSLLDAALAYSRKHFAQEERVIFPLAEKVMKQQTLTELGRAWIRQREAHPD